MYSLPTESSLQYTSTVRCLELNHLAEDQAGFDNNGGEAIGGGSEANCGGKTLIGGKFCGDVQVGVTGQVGDDGACLVDLGFVVLALLLVQLLVVLAIVGVCRLVSSAPPSLR